MNGDPKRSVDYLVGGFRISIGPESTTPGPRTHIVSFVAALRRTGMSVRTILASDLPFLSRFARVQQSDYVGAASWKVRIADFVRIGAALWSGICIFAISSTSPPPSIIYERMAVLQSLSSFHRWKKSSIRVIEANGILSRETSHDRKVLRAERLAAVIERHVLRKADLVVAISAALKAELMVHARLEESKILVVPNGVGEAFLAARRPARTPGRLIVGFVGSVVAWQHLDDFLEAAMTVQLAVAPEIRLEIEIIGEGGDLHRLQALVAERGWGDVVTFLGRQSHEGTLERMRFWDIGFAGHRRSSSATMYHSPLKLYEYAALGLVIVCTPSSDAQALAEAGAAVHLFEDPLGLQESLLTALKSVNDSTAEDVTRRREEIRSAHSWGARVDRVIDVVFANNRSATQGAQATDIQTRNS